MNSRPWYFVIPLLLLFVACSSPSSPRSPEISQKLVGGVAPKVLIPSSPDVYVVTIAPGTDPEQFAANLGLTLERVLEDNTVVVSGVLDESVLQNDADVNSFEQNQEVTLAFGQDVTMGFFEGESFETSDLDSSPVMSQRNLATVHSQWTGVGMLVGIIDTGADGDHPWLENRIGPSPNCDDLGWRENANGLDDDGDGEIDEAYGHGTMVAGIVAQLAPNARMVALRVLNSDGVGSLADILTAMDAVIEDDVDVVNLSLSLSQYSALFEDRLQRLDVAGIEVVVAAGNQGGPTAYPANSPLANGVAALAGETGLASFSNAGPDCEVAASGVGVLSSYPENQLGWGDGTSFAAPIVSGALALLISAGVDPDELLLTADSLDPLEYGRIDLLTVFQAHKTVEPEPVVPIGK